MALEGEVGLHHPGSPHPGLARCLAGAPQEEYRTAALVLVLGSIPIFVQNELWPGHCFSGPPPPHPGMGDLTIQESCCLQSTH